MKRVAILEKQPIFPFNEPACELRVLNKPLKIHQRDVLLKHCDSVIEYPSFDQIPRQDKSEMLVYYDNVFFDQPFIDVFVSEAKKRGKACRVAFSKSDQAITRHALHLQDGIHLEGDVYVSNLWYYPNGIEDDPKPLVIDTQATEIGYYHIPTYMASDKGEIVYYVPLRAFLSIEHWIHVFMANTPFGIFAEGARFEAQIKRLPVKLGIMLKGMWERKQVLSSSKLVRVGKNTSINPTAQIQGPTYIGDNCSIGPGVIIQNSIIGNNVTLMQGAQVMLSVISDNCYLPFRAAIFMSTLMERCIVAQNVCLQVCVVGRNTFIGSGTTFTDFKLIPKPILALRNGRHEPTGLSVVGGCVGHNCRIGSGLIIYPARAIESDTILIPTEEHNIISKTVYYEQSDHHRLRERDTELHRPLYRPETPPG